MLLFWLFLFPFPRMSASWRMTTLTSSWQTVISTWRTATSQSIQTPLVPTWVPAPRPLTTWTESWRTEITSWWWEERAWCCLWTTLSRPLQTPTTTTACGCEQVRHHGPRQTVRRTDPSHRADDQYLTRRLSLPCLFFYTPAHCLISPAFFFFSLLHFLKVTFFHFL